jgi:hypothetical protein
VRLRAYCRVVGNLKIHVDGFSIYQAIASLPVLRVAYSAQITQNQPAMLSNLENDGRPFIFRRTILVFALLAFVAINLGMAAVGVARCPAFFSQHGAHILVLEPVSALLAYAVAVVFIARRHGPYWDSILRAAMVFGGLTGTIEVINVGIENGIPFVVRGPVVTIGFMLATFTVWGIAGFRTARSLRSTRAGLLASVFSAGICMLIAVAAGFIVQFLLAPPEPAYVSTWAEFQRSGWTDARAFGVANTLDSAFTHLVIAPIVALFVGGLASLVAQFTSTRVSPIAR